MTMHVVEVDHAGAPLERPAYRLFALASDVERAELKVQRRLDRRGEGESVRRAVQLDDVLDPVRAKIASGVEVRADFKPEVGNHGPLVLVDVEAAATSGLGVPFGTEPKHMTVLPWMSRTDAQNIADRLGIRMEES